MLVWYCFLSNYSYVTPRCNDTGRAYSLLESIKSRTSGLKHQFIVTLVLGFPPSYCVAKNRVTAKVLHSLAWPFRNTLLNDELIKDDGLVPRSDYELCNAPSLMMTCMDIYHTSSLRSCRHTILLHHRGHCSLFACLLLSCRVCDSGKAEIH